MDGETSGRLQGIKLNLYIGTNMDKNDQAKTHINRECQSRALHINGWTKPVRQGNAVLN